MYLYQNSVDRITFLQYAESLGCAIYNYRGSLVDVLGIADNVGYLFIRPKNTIITNVKEASSVCFVPTYRGNNDIFQPGQLSLLKTDDKDQKDLKTIYKKLCLYIKEHYILSDHKDLYIGHSFYQDYNSYKVMVPFPLQYKIAILPASQFNLKGYLHDISHRGYIIENNGVYEEDSDGARCKGYIFHLPDACLKKKDEDFPIFFLSDSECVFLFKRKVKKELQYYFYLDMRLLDGSFPELEHLFDIIEEYVQ